MTVVFEGPHDAAAGDLELRGARLRVSIQRSRERAASAVGSGGQMACRRAPRQAGSFWRCSGDGCVLNLHHQMQRVFAPRTPPILRTRLTFPHLPSNKLLSFPRPASLITPLQTLQRAMASTSASLPKTMRAIRIHKQGGPEVMQLDEVPVPQPKDNEVLIRVEYSGCVGSELSRATHLRLKLASSSRQSQLYRHLQGQPRLTAPLRRR